MILYHSIWKYQTLIHNYFAHLSANTKFLPQLAKVVTYQVNYPQSNTIRFYFQRTLTLYIFKLAYREQEWIKNCLWMQGYLDLNSTWHRLVVIRKVSHNFSLFQVTKTWSYRGDRVCTSVEVDQKTMTIRCGTQY